MSSRWVSTEDWRLNVDVEACKAFALLRGDGREEGNTGGTFCVLKTDRLVADLVSTPLFLAAVGTVSDDAAAASYRVFAQEKALRLLSRPDDVSSFQSRDESEQRWGGAIRAGSYILSFSGLPELMDEALMLAVALHLGLIDRVEAERIAALSHNPFFARLIA